jgi:hypothetical protein
LTSGLILDDLLRDWNVGINVFPQRGEILVRRARFPRIAVKAGRPKVPV